MPRLHAVDDDALGDHDAVGLAEQLRHGAVSPTEVRAAVAARAQRVDPTLRGLVSRSWDAPVTGAPDGPLAGVPTLIKDNTDVRGLPTGHGSAAVPRRPAPAHAEVTEQVLATGLDVVGTSRMPEFGLNATTEFAARTGDDTEPTRNPWDTRYSCGASSGGAAALVAAGVVPIAHANDGGGSIRIPAAACGLVGLRPGRGRTAPSDAGRRMPIDLVADGVVTRSVRDTAAFLAAADRVQRRSGRARLRSVPHGDPAIPPLGLVEGPAARRLRIGLVLDSPSGARVDDATRAAVEDTARLLEKQGHVVEPAGTGLDARFVEDFVDYWGLLAFTIVTGGRLAFGRGFDPDRLDPLTHGLAARYRRAMPRTPAILRRLRRVRRDHDALYRHHDALLLPVLAHATPELGWLAPDVPVETLLPRLLDYVAFTPLNNVAGSPALSLPGGATADGRPVGVQLATARGDERTLLELAYAIEADRPFGRIQDG